MNNGLQGLHYSIYVQNICHLHQALWGKPRPSPIWLSFYRHWQLHSCAMWNQRQQSRNLTVFQRGKLSLSVSLNHRALEQHRSAMVHRIIEKESMGRGMDRQCPHPWKIAIQECTETAEVKMSTVQQWCRKMTRARQAFTQQQESRVGDQNSDHLQNSRSPSRSSQLHRWWSLQGQSSRNWKRQMPRFLAIGMWANGELELGWICHVQKTQTIGHKKIHLLVFKFHKKKNRKIAQTVTLTAMMRYHQQGRYNKTNIKQPRQQQKSNHNMATLRTRTGWFWICFQCVCQPF